MDINNLTEAEVERIMKVIEKEREVKSQEENYIKELKEKLVLIDNKSLSSEQLLKQPYCCSRCGQKFSTIMFFFYSFKYCLFCNKKICTKCALPESPNNYICIYCNTLRTLQGVSGSWFNDNNNRTQQIIEFPIAKITSLQRFQGSTESKIDLNIIDGDNSSETQLNLSLDEENEDTFFKTSHITANQIDPPIVASGITLNIFDKLPDVSRLTLLKDNTSNFSDKSSEQNFEFGPINYETQKPEILADINENLEISPPLTNTQEIEEVQENGRTSVHVLADSENALETISALPSILVESTSSLKAESCEIFPLNNENKQISASTSNLESRAGSLAITSRSLDIFNTTGALHGMIKIEKISDIFIIKIKVIEAINLRPIGVSATVSSYVVCRVMSNTDIIFKKKTTTITDCSAPVWGETFEFTNTSLDNGNLLIFLIVKKPEPTKSFKSMIKKDQTDNTIYGSVRIGGANYLSQEEKDIWEKLKNHADNSITDWIDFKIELKCAEAIDSGSSRQISSISSLANLDDEFVSLPEKKTRRNSDDTTSFFSLSSNYYDDDTITGSLTLFLKYSQQHQALTVTFVKGHRLTGQKSTSNYKVFAKCKIVPKSTENDTKTTIVSKNPYEPEWNSTFIFKLDLLVLRDTNLIANVYRVENLLSNKFIGQVVIPIEAIIDLNKKELIEGYCDEYPLTLKVPMGSYGFKGIVSLSLRFDPISYDGQYGNLEGRILKATDLQSISKNALPDSYVMCMLLPNLTKKDRKTSTIIKKSSNPEYNLFFSYQNINASQLKSSRCLEITIWSNKSTFIGGTRIGASQNDIFNEIWQDSNDIESNLWNKMFETPKEWVQCSLPLRYTMLSQISYPLLDVNVKQLFNDFIAQSGVLVFNIIYSIDPEPLFVVEINKVENLSVGNLPLLCKILLYSQGIVSKSHTQCISQVSENEWNQTITLKLVSSVEHAGIEFRLKTLSDQKKSKSSNTVVGRVLLSKGLTADAWNYSTQDEISFFNKVIETPNQSHSARLRLNIYMKPKCVSKKIDKQITKLKKSDSIAKIAESNLIKTQSTTQLFVSEKSNKNITSKRPASLIKNINSPTSLIKKLVHRKQSFDYVPSPISQIVAPNHQSTPNTPAFILDTPIIITDSDKVQLPQNESLLTITESFEQHESIQPSDDQDNLLLTAQLPVPPIHDDTRLNNDEINDSINETALDSVPEPQPIVEHTPLVIVIPEISNALKQQESSDVLEEKLGIEFVEEAQPLNIVLTNEIEAEVVVSVEKNIPENIEKEIDAIESASEACIKIEKKTEDDNIIDTTSPCGPICQSDFENITLETSLDIISEPPPIVENPIVLEETQHIFKKLVEIGGIEEPEAIPALLSSHEKNEEIKDNSVEKYHEDMTRMDIIPENDSFSIDKDSEVQEFNTTTVGSFEVPNLGLQKSKLSLSSLSLKQRIRAFEGNNVEDSKKLSGGSSFKKRFGSFKKRDSTSSGIVSSKVDGDTISTCMSLYSETPVTGEITIGFKYSNVDNKLTIIVKNAKNLMIHDPKKDKNNAFVEIIIFPDQKSKTNKFRTKEIKGSLSSMWNEDFTYFINPIDLKLRKIIATVYHKSFPKKVFLGQVIIPMDETLNQILKSGYIENSYPLSEKSKLTDIQTDFCRSGQLRVAFKVENIPFDKKSKKSTKKSDSILNIKILDAQNLATLVPVNSALVKVYLLNAKSNQDKKTTNSSDNKSGYFLWDQVLSFEFNRQQVDEYGILIKIVDSKKTNINIGTLQINNGSKKFEWQQALNYEIDAWNDIKNECSEYKEFSMQIRPPAP